MSDRVGADRVAFRGPSLIVESAADMPEWEFKSYRRTAVWFRDQCYFVAEKRWLPHGAYQYVLEPWGSDLADIPGHTVRYDEQYVVGRDAAARARVRDDRAAAWLSWISPLLGFLPSRVKLRLNDRYAFHPLTVTRQSLAVERIVFMCLGALIVIDRWTNAFGPAFGYVPWVAGVILIDMVFRTNPVTMEDVEQPGFLEWASPTWWGRKKND